MPSLWLKEKNTWEFIPKILGYKVYINYKRSVCEGVAVVVKGCYK